MLFVLSAELLQTRLMPSLPSGVETDAPFQPSITSGSQLLIQAVLRDQTDICSELLQENHWLLHPNQAEISLDGNAFALENVLDETGTVFLKLAPLPGARVEQSDWDLRIGRDIPLELNRADGYQWAQIPYQNGKWGCIAALHEFQRKKRPYHPLRDGLFLSNTWGDRNRDARIRADFVAGEIEAGARLGVDIIQIDDGWQQGITANSAIQTGGAWNGFWASDPNFWDVNRQKFPEGLAPLVQQACAKGMKFGLWFAPDSSNDGANWEKDAHAILRLHREEGVDFFKIDALKLETKVNEANLRRFFAWVARETAGKVTFDLDITAEKRFGYFGLIEPGPLFVENRYTDWGRYFPHHTLRVAWQLAHWVDPVRLRLEWLNNARNADKYGESPLAPAHYSPDCLFATTMFCSPLGWFETSSLPDNYFQKAAPLIETWKAHREAIQTGTILPVGGAPDGVAWTGFVSVHAERSGGYALLFRELNQTVQWSVKMPFLTEQTSNCEILGGDGTARLENGVLSVEIPKKLGFVWAKFY